MDLEVFTAIKCSKVFPAINYCNLRCLIAREYFIVIYINVIFNMFFLIASYMPIINSDVPLIRFANDYPSVSSPVVTSYVACFLTICW